MELITLIVTILLGIPGIIIYFRNRKTKLYYFEKRQINLQEDLLKNFSDLKITYDGIDINNKILYIKGCVICSGEKDLIDKKNEIQIDSQNATWINFKITNLSKGLEIDIVNKKDFILLNFGLLKSKEFFEFEGILKSNESNIGKKIELTFFHRIANLPKVKKLNVENYKGLFSIITSSIAAIVLSFYIVYDLSKLSEYNISYFDSKTNKELMFSEHIKNDSYSKALKSLKDEYYGYQLMFGGKSRNYNVKIFELKIDSKNYLHQITKEKSIYFKLSTSWLEYAFQIVCVIMFFIFILILFKGLILYNQKLKFNHILDV